MKLCFDIHCADLKFHGLGEGFYLFFASFSSKRKAISIIVTEPHQILDETKLSEIKKQLWMQTTKHQKVPLKCLFIANERVTTE